MAEPVHEHVGRALRARRVALGLTLRDLIHTAVDVAAFDLKWTENAPEPSVKRVHYYDSLLRRTALDLDAWKAMPYAQREQWYDTDLDDALWHSAMVASRRVSWWWGASKSRGMTGAWCYLCENMVHTYDAGRPMTHTARCAIMAHRGQHPVVGIKPAAALEGIVTP